jgi:hypothetical protein
VRAAKLLDKPLSLGSITGAKAEDPVEPACYPSMDISRRLVWRNLYFAVTNWDFSLLMGVIYWLMAIGLTLRDQWDAYAIVAAIFGSAIIGYTYKQEKSGRPSVLITSALHAVAHTLAVIYFARLFGSWNASHFTLAGEWYSGWKWLGILLIEMGLVGLVIGSTIFGLNLLITCRWFRMNRNDAFSSFRLGSYNNFLRLRIKDHAIEVFAIGLNDVPERDGWTHNPKAGPSKSNEPTFLPDAPLQPHLIEKFSV